MQVWFCGPCLRISRRSRKRWRASRGVEIHGSSDEVGRIVVTVEDGEGWSVTDSILAVNLAPKVQAVTLAYEYTDDGLELTEA